MVWKTSLILPTVAHNFYELYAWEQVCYDIHAHTKYTLLQWRWATVLSPRERGFKVSLLYMICSEVRFGGTGFFRPSCIIFSAVHLQQQRHHCHVPCRHYVHSVDNPTDTNNTKLVNQCRASRRLPLLGRRRTPDKGKRSLQMPHDTVLGDRRWGSPMGKTQTQDPIFSAEERRDAIRQDAGSPTPVVAKPSETSRSKQQTPRQSIIHDCSKMTPSVATW
jgi:hypothetical protein